MRAWLLTSLMAVATISPLAQAQSAGNYVIGAQDVIMVTVIEDTSLNGKYRVEADGSFTMPLIGVVKAGGLTVRQFEDELKRRLRDGKFIRNPQVTVGVDQVNSQKIMVMGEVRVPGVVPIPGAMNLIEAIVRAGGTTTSASGDVTIVRNVPGKDPENIRLNLAEVASGRQGVNVTLQNGDMIIAERAGTIFISGEVKSPNQYTIQGEITVRQALVLAGGATEDAALNRIKILRPEKGQIKPKEINKAQLEDIVKAGDTIIVPTKYW